MPQILRLEDFGGATGPSDSKTSADPADARSEADRVAAYEAGYSAGWEDAVKSQLQDQERIGAEFARNLQELGFTFHEARAHVIRSMTPLLGAIAEKILPQLMRDTIRQTVLEEILPLAEDAADTPIEILHALENGPTLAGLLESGTSIPLKLVEEPTLAEGQVYLRLGRIEKQIDLRQALDNITSAISGVSELSERTLRHG